jgi:hypothetical protein
VRTDLISRPRPVPSRLLPLAGAGVAVGLALPVVLVGGWPLKGWVLGAVLWAGLAALSLVIAQLRARTKGVASSSLQGIELLVKALAVLSIVLAAARSDGSVAVVAIVVYALGYTHALMLSVASYFGNES